MSRAFLLVLFFALLSVAVGGKGRFGGAKAVTGAAAIIPKKAAGSFGIGKAKGPGAKAFSTSIAVAKPKFAAASSTAFASAGKKSKKGKGKLFG